MVMTVTSYKTTDGKLFDSQEEAKKHQAEVDITNWYENNILEANDNGFQQIPTISTREMLDYIKKHKDALKGMLSRL